MIEDSVPGIPEEERGTVRDRFFRGRNKTKLGNGFGLSIAELATRKIGGELLLENRDEGGIRASFVPPNSARVV